MTKLFVKLEKIQDIEHFINISKNYDFDIDFISGKYVVNGKSIMGVLSLDLTKPIEVHIHSDDATDFVYKIKDYCVK